MAEALYDAAFVVVLVSGLVVVWIEATRRVPWNGRPWQWFVQVKGTDAEWLLLLSGVALAVLAGLSDSQSHWWLVAAPVIGAWVVYYLGARPVRRRVPPDSLHVHVGEPGSNVSVVDGE